MSRQYSNPPIETAVCEFRFPPTKPWDLVVPGLMYTNLSKDFPVRLPARRGQGVSIQLGPEGIVSQQVVDQPAHLLPPELRLWRSDDDTGEIVIAPHRLAVHHRAPYPSWVNVLPVIQQALKEYISAAEPDAIQRIGLRYINRIRFDPTTEIDLESYLDFYPFLGDRLPQTIDASRTRVDIPYSDGRDSLRLNLSAPIRQLEEPLVVTLDLDYSLVEPGGVQFDEVTSWLEHAHDQIEAVFEGCLKEPLREMFDARSD